MAASTSRSELRLVVFGCASPVCTILGLQEHQQCTDAAPMQECCKHTGEAAGRKVVVVSTPAWFSSSCEPKERRKHISSFIALSSPGPHAFLLCVPVKQPADGEAEALDVLKELFGPSAVSGNTIVVLTHTEEQEEDESLEEYLVNWRKDLQELVERCGGRYHTLERRGEETEEGQAVQQLLQKVEQVVAESGLPHVSCPLYQKAEERVRARQAEMARQRRRKELTDSPQQTDVTEEEMEAVREEAERSIEDLNVDIESILPSASILPSSPTPSFLWVFWEKLKCWVKWLPTIVRHEALIGALVGLFVGGPLGSMMGATVGSVATEVKRRKTQKTK